MPDSDRNIANGQSSDKGNSSLVHNGSTLSQLDSLVTKVTSQSQPTHTPGPWAADKNDIYATRDGCLDELLATTYPMGRFTGSFYSNANLIAAAPELLEALEAMLQAFIPVTPLQAKATDATRAVITRAKGGAA